MSGASIGPVELLILTVLFIAVLVILAVVLARGVAGAVRGAVRSDLRERGLGERTAREILDERYAQGEVGREEYERMRRDLAG